MFLDYSGLKEYVNSAGIKQKSLAEKSGMQETTLCLILQGRRKCEAGEYASICNALGVSFEKFLKSRMPDGITKNG